MISWAADCCRQAATWPGSSCTKTWRATGSLYLTPAVDQRDSAFRFIPVEGVSVYYWHDDDFAYALASEVPREQLKAICNEVYSKLNPNAGPVEW